MSDTQARLDAARTALRCLRLEVPASVHDDVVAKIEPLLAELERVTAALRETTGLLGQAHTALKERPSVMQCDAEAYVRWLHYWANPTLEALAGGARRCICSNEGPTALCPIHGIPDELAGSAV